MLGQAGWGVGRVTARGLGGVIVARAVHRPRRPTEGNVVATSKANRAVTRVHFGEAR
jgi:hypothetical protein